MPPSSYPVPPEDVSLWNDEDKEIFEVWQKWMPKGTTKKFRKFLGQVKKERDEIFDLINDGVWGIRRLLAFLQKLPGYDLEGHLEFYNNEENIAVMNIINLGLNVVQDEQLRCGLEVVYADKQPNTVTVKTDVSADHVKDKINVEKVKTESADELSQLSKENNNTPKLEQKQKKKKSINKKRREERLLRFQEKLVITSGLPPSRLMKKRLEKASPQGMWNAKKNLAGDFEELAVPRPANVVGGHSVLPGQPALHVQMPGHSASPPPSSVMMPGQQSCPLSVPALIPEQPALAFPFPVLMPGQQALPFSSLTPGQNSHPQLGFIHEQAVQQTGITSGFDNFSTLYSSPVTFVGDVNSPSSQVYPFPQVGLPAYCFHCLQFGKVFTLNPV